MMIGRKRCSCCKVLPMAALGTFVLTTDLHGLAGTTKYFCHAYDVPEPRGFNRAGSWE
ncbi:MAG: hypothetical protein M3R30_10290 [Candidatus Eremiobacteraeota bacterium]|nr:hypothetical protein [Candidatus Eremiobacteraeota bacterium]